MDAKLKQNFGLTEASFNEMLTCLQEGDEALFKMIFLSHFNDCIKFLKRKCSANHNDAYDVTMETLICFRARCLMGKVKYGNLRFLFTQMAYQLYLRYIKGQDMGSPKLDLDVSSKESQMIDAEDRVVLNKAWEKLGDSCKKLLTSFYFENITIVTLAEEQGKPSSTLRKQKQRCINQLRLSFKQTFTNGK